ncbi:MAG: MaoC family dehydratase N-terminal domain-containing protein [Proteobacteria bacterium]|nr:MaoC family dehydratase N-terminal domain-containing protein [Pseudomonadota bacterium]
MPIDYDRLMNRRFPEIEQDYRENDTILYALSVGLGFEPDDGSQLRYVYEDDLEALPTMAVILGYPGFWMKDPDSGIDWRRVLHGEQGLTIHQPLAAAGKIVGKTRITEIVDKGRGKGALVYAHRDICDRQTGNLLCTVTHTAVCRGNGGFGGPSRSTRPAHELPDRAPDAICELPTYAHSALLYRLNGDLNPLHADPDIARQAGFPRPILHGLCTFGVAGHALLRALCGYDAARLRRMEVRFSAPVFPGETIRTEIWREAPGRAGFRCGVKERNIVVINSGLAEYVV